MSRKIPDRPSRQTADASIEKAALVELRLFRVWNQRLSRYAVVGVSSHDYARRSRGGWARQATPRNAAEMEAIATRLGFDALALGRKDEVGLVERLGATPRPLSSSATERVPT